MRASDLFVAALEKENVEFVFGIPGEETLDLLDSLSRSKIRLILQCATNKRQGLWPRRMAASPARPACAWQPLARVPPTW